MEHLTNHHMCILDLNKVRIKEFHYDYIKNKYGNKSRLLFTDDVYGDLREDKEIVDFSNYSSKSKWFDDSNNGKMKDETSGVPIEEFVG